MSLRTKISLIILIPAIVIIAVSSVIHYHSEREEALATMSLLASQTGNVIERAIQHDMLESDFEHILQVFSDIGEDPRIGSLLLMDPSGRVVFSPEDVQTGKVMSNQERSCQPCHLIEPNERPPGIVTNVENGQRFFRSMHPIENQPACHACHDADQEIIGVLLTDFSIEPIEQNLASDLRGNIIWWVATVLAIIILVNYSIRRWLINRIESLETAMDGFGLSSEKQNLSEGPQDEIGRLSHTFNVMAGRISRREAENQTLSEALQIRIAERGNLLKQFITSQEEERVRVARELHDELGQSLSSSALQIEMAKRQLDPDEEETIAHLDHANKILEDATDQMYDLISGLRPSVLDDLGLEAAFKSLAKRVLEPADIDFKVDCSALNERLPPELEIVIYRVFQEAFTNILRHGQASEVSLKIKMENTHVLGEIMDNGVGFKLEQPGERGERSNGLGLIGMRERVEQCNGEFTIQSKLGEGTRITLRLPLENNHDV